MIYVCVPSHNDDQTVGLLLWKIRKVFGALPREFQLLVANDGSTDATAEVLKSYLDVLPMTVFEHDTHRGYAATVEDLLREAVRLTDRPKRDCVVILNGDFSVSPSVLPDLLKGLESGADVVVGEAPAPPSWAERMVQRASPWLLGPGIRLPGVRDLLSGTCAIRLVTVKRCMDDRRQRLLDSTGIPARAELVARAASHARQVSTVALEPQTVRRGAGTHERPMALAMQLYRTGRTLDIPQPDAAERGAS
jgi:hypothetical protein